MAMKLRVVYEAPNYQPADRSSIIEFSREILLHEVS